jgi:hypothetical protein
MRTNRTWHSQLNAKNKKKRRHGTLGSLLLAEDPKRHVSTSLVDPVQLINSRQSINEKARDKRFGYRNFGKKMKGKYKK